VPFNRHEARCVPHWQSCTSPRKAAYLRGGAHAARYEQSASDAAAAADAARKRRDCAATGRKATRDASSKANAERAGAARVQRATRRAPPRVAPRPRTLAPELEPGARRNRKQARRSRRFLRGRSDRSRRPTHPYRARHRRPNRRDFPVRRARRRANSVAAPQRACQWRANSARTRGSRSAPCPASRCDTACKAERTERPPHSESQPENPVRLVPGACPQRARRSRARSRAGKPLLLRAFVLSWPHAVACQAGPILKRDFFDGHRARFSRPSLRRRAATVGRTARTALFPRAVSSHAPESARNARARGVAVCAGGRRWAEKDRGLRRELLERDADHVARVT